MSSQTSAKNKKENAAAKSQQGFRETVESIAVAIILALLFRGFVAEAFVIPTGSMAPTLMGAHKDLTCPHCGYEYQVGASVENRITSQHESHLNERQVRHLHNQRAVVFMTICPNCRSDNPLDLANDKLHRTFNGDRILVSKFSYAMDKPERWDVIVFKYPFNAKQYYIKRLVGLENETLQIFNGDIYTKPADGDKFEIARKPPARQLAMSHLVYDANHLPTTLLEAGWPTRWQPWELGADRPPESGWEIETDDGKLRATLEKDDSTQTRWLRYFHRLPNFEAWHAARAGGSLSDVDPYGGGAVSDFYGYDTYATVSAGEIFTPTGGISPLYDPDANSLELNRQPGFGNSGLSDLGTYWVGDLVVEGLVNVNGESGFVELDLVEAGVHYRCSIDVESGLATLQIEMDGEPQPFDGEDNTQPQAETAVDGPGIYHLRFSNYDDQLRLWIGGELIEFPVPTTFPQPRRGDALRPYFSDRDPLDAAPVAIGGRNVAMQVSNLKVMRDKHYIAMKGGSRREYNRREVGRILDEGLPGWQTVIREGFSNGLRDNSVDRAVQELLTSPQSWEDVNIWKARDPVTFNLEDGQYFPMGDNSPESLDARIWDADPFVDEDLLIGKALFIFWPHSWPEPVPFTPNFERMRFIR